jgi:hypothetical protein
MAETVKAAHLDFASSYEGEDIRCLLHQVSDSNGCGRLETVRFSDFGKNDGILDLIVRLVRSSHDRTDSFALGFTLLEL